MSGFLVHVGATAMCPHGGQVSTISTNSRVFVSGQPVATQSDNYLIAGCTFNVSGSPHPCIRIQWPVPASRVLINGQPAILQTNVGICQSADQSPQGSPIQIVTQTRVRGI